MLGKLIKHEWNAVARLFIPMYIALIIITGIGKLLLSTNAINSFPAIISGLFVFVYVFLILIIFIGTSLYLVVRFYKNLYGDEGYLMHTLPVTTNQKLLSKSIVAFLFSMISFLLCAASIFVLVITKDAWAAIPEAIQQTRESLLFELGMSLEQTIAIFIVTCLIGLLSQIFMCYASISIGQLFKGHKIIGSIAGFVAFSTISQVISSILLIIIQIDKIENTTDFIPITFTATSILSALLCIAYYLVTYFMMQKKLNMD